MAQLRQPTVADLERELRTMRGRLVASERELEATRARLSAFGARYQATVGERFETLRKLQIALGIVAEQTPEVLQMDGVAPGPTSRPPGRTEFERLYRDLARQVHPDLARDPAELELRTRVMAELNSAREMLDIERIRRLGDVWQFRPEDIAPETDVSPVERLSVAIDTVQARHTAVAADLTRLQHSSLHVLMNIVEAQQRAGTDMLGETAADLDVQIAEARSRMALAPRRAPDLVRRTEPPSTVATVAPIRSPLAGRDRLALFALIAAGFLALVAALAASGMDRASPVITGPAVDPRSVATAPPPSTPAPVRYRVVERETSASGRSTATVRIVVDGAPTDAEKISTLVAAARAQIASQQAVVVFAYRSATEVGGPFTVGRAYLSVDGRGWSGDGRTEDGPDIGGVTGSIVIGSGTDFETRTFVAGR